MVQGRDGVCRFRIIHTPCRKQLWLHSKANSRKTGRSKVNPIRDTWKQSDSQQRKLLDFLCFFVLLQNMYIIKKAIRYKCGTSKIYSLSENFKMNSNTNLYRQIHPSFIKNGGHIMSRAFHPSPNDPCRLSVYDGDQITAEKAWRHYTSTLKRESSGVMAVTMAQCNYMNLKVVPDPHPYKEHAFVDFSSLTKKQRKKMSQDLRTVAKRRGWLFRPNSDNTTKS